MAAAAARRFRVLGIQQIAVGGLSKCVWFWFDRGYASSPAARVQLQAGSLGAVAGSVWIGKGRHIQV